MAMTIRTNNVPRDIVYGWELTNRERKDFDYYRNDEELESAMFFRFRGDVYDIGNFERCGNSESLKGWDAYTCDSMWSGMVIRFPRMDYNPREWDTEHIIVGSYYS